MTGEGRALSGRLDADDSAARAAAEVQAEHPAAPTAAPAWPTYARWDSRSERGKRTRGAADATATRAVAAGGPAGARAGGGPHLYEAMWRDDVITLIARGVGEHQRLLVHIDGLTLVPPLPQGSVGSGRSLPRGFVKQCGGPAAAAAIISGAHRQPPRLEQALHDILELDHCPGPRVVSAARRGLGAGARLAGSLLASRWKGGRRMAEGAGGARSRTPSPFSSKD